MDTELREAHLDEIAPTRPRGGRVPEDETPAAGTGEVAGSGAPSSPPDARAGRSQRPPGWRSQGRAGAGRADAVLSSAIREAQEHLGAGRLAEAAAVLAPHVEHRRRWRGPSEYLVILAHNQMGVIAKFQGNFDAAQAHYDRVACSPALAEAPALAATLEHNFGGLAHSRGRLDEAESRTRAGLELRRALHGDGSVQVLADLGQLGAIVSERGRFEEAVELLTQTRDGFAEHHGCDHVEVGLATTALASAHHRNGDLVMAEELYREGLAIRSAATGADNPDLAWALTNLAVVVRKRGADAEADELLHRARRVLVGQVSADHPLLVRLQARLAEPTP